ncbi:MAG: PorP/SprF family type IX secretion system membrane protein [Crocinitomicaceae bacterium]|nr:PorP/SprF family type IX secretion system membrane protein [Crocinitomicaceae bacterium]
MTFIKSIVIVLGLSLGTSLSGNAQDAFFSHFNYSNSQTNPAQAAISEDVNLRLIHRSQWMSLVKPFSTSQFEGSFPLRKSVTGEKFGVIGVSFVNDRLGEGGYMSTNQFGISFTYNMQLNNESNIAIGAKAGYFNGATSIDAITTGSQWTGATFNPQAALGESIANPIIKGVELSPGIMWYQNDSLNDSKYYFGISAFNLLQPETGEIVQGFGLPTRFSVTGGANFFAVDNFSIGPKGLFMLQGNQTHVVFGSDWMYHLQRNTEKRIAIGIGTYYRLGDSFITGLKYLTNTFDLGVSYDMNTSNLSDGLSTNTGSIEIFLNYKIASKKIAKPFLFSIEVFDQSNKELLPANVSYKSLTTGDAGIILDNKVSGTFDLHLKEEYIITVEKTGYESQSIPLKNIKETEVTQKVYLVPTVKTFDLEMQVFDKETNDPLNSKVYIVDPSTGVETLLGDGDKINTSLEIGRDHKLIVKSDGYDDQEVVVSYDKYGTLNKPVYMDKSFLGAYLNLKIVDEDSKEEIKATVMVSDITVSNAPINALMVMNDFTPEKYPLDLNRTFEILVTKEGYFNNSTKIKVENDLAIQKTIELSALGIGKSIVLDDLLFKTGKAELDARSYRLLDQMVDFMNQNATLRIEIGGHTDDVGSNSSNKRLSEARAKSAIIYISAKGISASRMIAKGYGEASPIADNATIEGRTQNRRVEMKVIGK